VPNLLTEMESETAQAGMEKDDLTASVDASLLRGRIPHIEMHVERIAEGFKRQLAETRPNELRLGVSPLGPHRDDLLFQLGDLPMGAYGSRGQQRTAVLALKLAEVDLMTDETGDTPILLLDDIMSELDLRRRGYLLSVLSGRRYQSLITATDLAGFDPAFLAQSDLLEVRRGEVVPAEEASISRQDARSAKGRAKKD
jgi:DNA replication and repair protein RecF